MARVTFDLVRRFDPAPRRVWDELVDWPGHGSWIPMTTVDVDAVSVGSQPTDVGFTFTAWSGVRPLALEDRMRVTRCDWNDDELTGVCAVDKLGPVLGGSAGFSVRPDGAGTALEWREDVTISWLPQFLAPIARQMGVAGFKMALRSLDRVMRAEVVAPRQ